MLPKQFRLKNPLAFNATYKNHHIISDDYICIYIGKENNTPSIKTRIAFVVSKKIHKRAVIRNRIKRLMRESVRLAIKNNNYSILNNKYISFICVAKSSSINATFNTINSSINNLLSRVL